MAVWRIPKEYIIDWSPNGDSVHTFSKKTKDCLEMAFDDVYELDERVDSIRESINSIISGGGYGSVGSGNATSICGIGVEIAGIGDGHILVYRESDQKFHNEQPSTETSTSPNVEHLARLVENIYLTLDVAGLNPGGYDALSGETFYGDTNDIDTTSPHVTSLIQGDDSLALDSADGLVEGSIYFLTDGTVASWVKIKQIRAGDKGAQVILQEPVAKQFDINSTRLRRSRGIIYEGGLSSKTGTYSVNGFFFVTNLIPFINEVTGEEKTIRKAHLAVKHQNIADAEITAEISLRESATFVKGEIIGIGNGLEQEVRLANRTALSSYKFALYFNGEKQTKDFSFDPTTGEVIFNAPTDSIVSVDYFYNWGEESFAPMTNAGVYPDRRNPDRVTTQFTYAGEIGKVTAIRLILKRGRGNTEITTIGTGKAQGIKFEHQAIADKIQVTSATATFTYNESQNTVIVTAPVGETVTINYDWRGKSFNIDSFVCMFDE